MSVDNFGSTTYVGLDQNQVDVLECTKRLSCGYGRSAESLASATVLHSSYSLGPSAVSTHSASHDDSSVAVAATTENRSVAHADSLVQVSLCSFGPRFGFSSR